MDPEQRGVYVTIISQIVSEGAPIEDCDAKNSRMSNCNSRKFRAIKQALVNAGKLVIVDGRIGQLRAQIELKKSQTMLRIQRERGAKGGRKSAEKLRNANKNNKSAQAEVDSRIKPDYQPPFLSLPLRELEPNGSNCTPPEAEGFPKAPKTARDHLRSVLDDQHADAVIAHRKLKRAPLTPRAAELLAGKFGRCPDPNAAADTMIVNGWQGFEPKWMENRDAKQPDRRSTGGQAAGVVDDLREAVRRAEERDRARRESG